MEQTLSQSPVEEDGQDAAAYVGAVLGERYIVGQIVGAGGMGVVYEARHAVFGTRLAVKILRPLLRSAALADEANERFAREARAASAIGHPNIVDVRDMGTLPDGTSYYVMEHLDGRDLAAELELLGRLAPPRVAHIGAQIAGALDAAHARGVIHRDLKPENVFLTSRRDSSGVRDPDFVKVIDFGIAKLAETGSSDDEGRATAASSNVAARGRDTVAGIILGTPVYMSPEQCAARATDGRSDVYSLGVVLYEALAGKPPFDGEDVVELMLQHQTHAPPPLSSHGWTGPAELEALVMRCLAKQPAARVGSMRELADGLRAFVSPPDERAPSFSVAFAPPIDAAVRLRAEALDASPPAALVTTHGAPASLARTRGAGSVPLAVALVLIVVGAIGLAFVAAIPQADSVRAPGATPPGASPPGASVAPIEASAARDPAVGAADSSEGASAPLEPSAEAHAASEPVSLGRTEAPARRAPLGRRLGVEPESSPEPASTIEADSTRSRTRVLDLVADPWGE